jgi:hypothetical protein
VLPLQKRSARLAKRPCFRPRSGSKFTLLLHLHRHRHRPSALQPLTSTFLGISDLIPNPCTYVSELILISRGLRPLDDPKTTHSTYSPHCPCSHCGMELTSHCILLCCTPSHYPLPSRSPTDTSLEHSFIYYMSRLHLSHVFLNTSRSLYCMQHVPHPLCVSQASTLVWCFRRTVDSLHVYSLLISVSNPFQDAIGALTDVGEHIQKRKVSRFVICFPLRVVGGTHTFEISHGSASSKNFDAKNSFNTQSLRILESVLPWSPLGSFPSLKFTAINR